MAQFDLYENPSPHSKERVPYLLDVQHDLLKHLNTRVVIPLMREKKSISHLNPVLEIAGERFMLSTQEMAGVPADTLGKKVTTLLHHRDEIIHAIDFLITGF